MTAEVRLAAAEPEHDHAGLRERKKAATRLALSKAAMQLAIDRGLENVLVEDIADAAGVSARTFNNYFASKYEAICALPQDRAIRIGDALRARPAGEPLWQSLTEAIVSQFTPRGRPGMSGQALKDWIDGLRLVVTSPPLVGEYLKVQWQTQYHLAEAIAERLGTDQQTDMFPRILAGSVAAAMQAAVEHWLRSDPPVAVEPLLRESLRRLAQGMRDLLPAASS